jgi:hypothetical protein
LTFDVPCAVENLERSLFNPAVTVALEALANLVRLCDARRVRHDDPACCENLGRFVYDVPWLGQIEHHPIEAVTSG